MYGETYDSDGNRYDYSSGGPHDTWNDRRIEYTDAGPVEHPSKNENRYGY